MSQHGSQEPTTIELSGFTDAHFASRLVGNLGAALSCDEEASVRAIDQYAKGSKIEEQLREPHISDNPLLAGFAIESEREARRRTLIASKSF